MEITCTRCPTDSDWLEVKRRALLTSGMKLKNPPTSEWKHKILEARHSPIRYLIFSFLIEGIPYWVACELRTHVHDMPYVSGMLVNIKSSRNDRQNDFDRNAARQDTPVNMMIDINGEQIQILANKRLCFKATREAREVVKAMCETAIKAVPEYEGLLVPLCEYCNGKCHELYPCGRY